MERMAGRSHQILPLRSGKPRPLQDHGTCALARYSQPYQPNSALFSSELRVPFAEELARLLPDEIPNRAAVISKSARHLELIVEANSHFNLTRILDAREAAIKHILDSVHPWRVFGSAKQVLDAGTGAGFPGIPLAIVFPATHFILSESIGKKARFVESAVSDLGLANVEVLPARAEEILRRRKVDIITARAVAPIVKALDLFAPAIRQGAKAILYKGPDADAEIAAAEAELRKRRVRVRVLDRYELPDGFGSRTICEMSA